GMRAPHHVREAGRMQRVRSATDEGASVPADARPNAGRPQRGPSNALWLGLGLIGGALLSLAVVLAIASALKRGSEAAALSPRFVEESAAAGVDHVYDGEFPYFVGGGVATFDCDGDRNPALYFAGGANPAALYRNESPIGGALRFAKVSDPTTDLTRVLGVYPIDVDGDALTDL